MFGRYVTFPVKGLGSFTVFVFCTPSATESELLIMAKGKVMMAIKKGEAHLIGDEISFTPEGK